MNTSSLFSLGTKAMAASQAALATTGHNIANANVQGYSRQQAELASAPGQYSGSGYFGKGVDVVYDPVGGDLAEPVFRAIAWRGRYLVIGFAQGGIPNLPLNLPLLKGASLVGVFWGEFARREPQANARMLAELAQWYARGLVKPVIDQRLPMTALPEAFARMGTRKVRGKLVLVND